MATFIAKDVFPTAVGPTMLIKCLFVCLIVYWFIGSHCQIIKSTNHQIKN